jgi:hypothetical protein
MPAFVAPSAAVSMAKAEAPPAVAPPVPSPIAPAQPEPQPVATAEGNCKIDFTSVPASRVQLDGHRIGTTPKLAIAAPAGAHVVVFEHPVHGRLTTSVDCRGGETKSVSVRLGRAPDVPADAGQHK